MMSIVYVFWMYVVLFAVIGAMRGWAKELLVSFSVILALTTNHVLRRYIPLVEALPPDSTSLFWIRTMIVITLVYFGYQTVVSVARLGLSTGNAIRDQDEAALMIDIISGKNDKLLWRGVSTRYVYTHNEPDELTKIINTHVDAILAQFPPGRESK